MPIADELDDDPRVIFRLASGTAGALRRFTMVIDGRPVAKVRLGRSVEVRCAAGSHTIGARIDWHHSQPVSVELSAGSTTVVDIEYSYLVMHDSWLRPRHPFDIVVRAGS